MLERLTRWENNDKDVADLIEEKSDIEPWGGVFYFEREVTNEKPGEGV